MLCVFPPEDHSIHSYETWTFYAMSSSSQRASYAPWKLRLQRFTLFTEQFKELRPSTWTKSSVYFSVAGRATYLTSPPQHGTEEFEAFYELARTPDNVMVAP